MYQVVLWSVSGRVLVNVPGVLWSVSGRVLVSVPGGTMECVR